MKTIKLEKLTILNFKGIEKLSIDFGSQTNIFGANEAGKTSVWDAFNWLITGKESNNSEKFPIKRLDKSGKQIENINVSVEGFFVITDDNGPSDLIIKREFVENWGAEKRGSSNIVFKGNTTNYFWNNAPLKTETEFADRIEDVFGSAEMFKILTNPSFFSSDAFDWKKRRAILESLVGEISDEWILMQNPALSGLINQLKTKSLSDIKSEANHNKKLLKEEQSKIKTRIEEAKLSKVDPVDEDEVNKQIADAHDQLDVIDQSIADQSKKTEQEQEKKMEIQREIWDLESENAKLYNTARQEFEQDQMSSSSKTDTLKKQLSSLTDEIKTLKSRAEDGMRYLDQLVENKNRQIDLLKRDIQYQEEKMDGLRKDFKSLSAEVFVLDEDETICQLCKRPHDPDILAQHKADAMTEFNIRIASRKKQINEDGQKAADIVKDFNNKIKSAEDDNAEKSQRYKSEIEKLETQIKEKNQTADMIEAQISELESGEQVEITPIEQRLPKKFAENAQKIDQLKSSLQDRPSTEIDPSIVDNKKQLIDKISSLKIDLSRNENNKKVDQRVLELQNIFTEIGQKLSANDKIAFDADDYERFKFEELERRVNDQFKFVRFKMFNALQNGGFEQTCIATYNGVPYVNGGLNTAAKINVGIDIISTLSKHYKMQLPLFLDNRESCTSIPDTDLQIINLFVSADDKKLRIEIK